VCVCVCVAALALPLCAHSLSRIHTARDMQQIAVNESEWDEEYDINQVGRGWWCCTLDCARVRMRVTVLTRAEQQRLDIDIGHCAQSA
jgi:hypothetical protein